jgi:unsaturated chondroitin disaccharide hydrolase
VLFLDREHNSLKLGEAVTKALRQIDRTLAEAAGCFPHYTERGKWVMTQDGSWTGGMWVGQLLTAYQLTGDRSYLDAALHLLPVLEDRIDRPEANFDLGFLLMPSFVRGYEILKDEDFRQVGLHGAMRMLDFFNAKAGLIYNSYPERTARYGRPVASAIVDILMNLALLWWAHEETGEFQFYRTAYQHAKRTATLHIRPNGSTFHVVDFELETGQILNRGTIHGYSDSSTWARGQAWALYGFAMAYNATQDSSFYDAADSLSAYFQGRLPPDGLSYWDLSDPDIPNAIRDSSASAIAASGWLLMKDEWHDSGKALLNKIAAYTLEAAHSNGILSYATAYKTQGRGIQGSTVWGDYFFLRGLARLTGDDTRLLI